jgi:hypothetical protein
MKHKTVWGSRSDITDRYNETNLNFAGNYAVKFRIYNEGLAYRFVTDSREQNVRVQGEEVNYRFSDGVKALLLQWEGYESPYGITIMDSLPAERKVFLPMIVHAGKKAKVAITESDLYEYPSLFLKREMNMKHSCRALLKNMCSPQSLVASIIIFNWLTPGLTTWPSLQEAVIIHGVL